MSTVAYKHSLRHHVPSGHNQHSSPPSPSESPKSATASLKSRGSKRERVKETVDHLLHKFHIPHHHHGHHEHEHSSQDTLHAPVTPEKKSLLAKRASFAASLRPGSLKRKSVVADADVTPTLNYKTSRTLSTSSSFHDDRSSDSSNTAAEDELTAVSESPKSSKSPSRIPGPVLAPSSPTNDELATTLPELSVDVDDVFTEPKPPATEPVKASEEHLLEPLPEVKEDATSPAAPVGAVNEEKSVDMIDAPPAVESNVLVVESTTQTDAVTDIPPQDTPIETCLIHPSTQAIPTSSYTPATIPTYIELRKATEAHRRAKVEKPSWIRYIYGSFIKPVVVVAVECTVAAVCYGLVKVLERKPQRAVSLRSDQLKLA